jgi:steroid delta-isomerase-like uncharacterized protein
MPGSNVDILRDLADAFNARDFDRARQLMSDDIEFIDVASGQTARGHDGVIEYVQGWFGAFPDMQLETRALVADESYAAGEFVGRGTHNGTLPTPGGEVPATGRKLDERFVWFADIADGKITGVRDYYNAMAVMMQLGLMPEPAAATS